MIKITDQGCPTNAPITKLFVNTEKEVTRGFKFVHDFDELSKLEQKFVNHVLDIQDLTDFSRFRAYGQLGDNNEKLIVIVTEFTGDMDNDKLWQEINKVRIQTKAHYWVMDEHPENNQRQVEFSWRVDHLTNYKIDRLLEKLLKQTKKIWDQAGVGVC